MSNASAYLHNELGLPVTPLRMGVFALTILPAAFLAGRQLVLRLPTSGRQTLLANRFNLKVRRGTRELDVYALVLARPDGKLGPSWAGGGFSDTA